MDVQAEVLKVLDEVLSLRGRSAQFSAGTPLLGSIPELDSMAVVGVITTLEERFGIVVEDDELDGSTFATVGSLSDFIRGKIAEFEAGDRGNPVVPEAILAAMAPR